MGKIRDPTGYWHMNGNHIVEKGGKGMEKQQDSRRSLLKHILAGTCVIAGATVAARSAKAGPANQRAPEEDRDLYRETPEFKKYYKSLRS